MRKRSERKEAGLKKKVKLGTEAEEKGKAESDTGEEREKNIEREK